MTDGRELFNFALEGYEPEVGRALWRLQDARQDLLTWLDDLVPEAVDWQPDDIQINTVGTLLYHIAVIEMDWLYTEVLQQDWTPEAAALFPFDVRNSEGRLTAVRDLSLHAHLHRLAEARRILLDGFRSMTLDDFRRPRSLPDYEVTPEWVLHHLTVHETEHRGEMQMLVTIFNSRTN